MKFLAKMGRTALETISQVEEFLKEVKSIRALDHPNIMKLEAVFQAGGKFCIVSDLATGERLSSLP